MPTAQIASDLERDYEAVLNFRHDLQELCGELDDLTLSDVCEADEIYVTAGENGIEKEDESPRSRGLKKKARTLRVRQTASRDTRPSERRTVEFLVRENLQDVDEEIAEKGDETVILCPDDYTIYDDIDEYDGTDAHLAITHDDTYVIGDAHVNSCENRHSFLRQWLAKFRGVSKHHLQGYLNFLALLLNDDTDWFSKILSYESSR